MAADHPVDPNDFPVNVIRGREPWWTADIEAGMERSFSVLPAPVRLAHQWLILLDREVKDLRRELEAVRAFGWKGVWKPAGDYAIGNVVTYRGGMWHCDKAGTTAKPGHGEDWTLCVKSGR
jgi:hypothetical protein